MRTHAVLGAWVALVLAVTVPWSSVRPHPHWDRIAWIPFRSGIIRPSDLAGNLALYLPLGWWWTRGVAHSRVRPLLGAVLSALVLSLACEWSQVYSHGRFPSATDVLMNTLGAALGVLLFDRRSRERGENASHAGIDEP